MGVGEGKGDVKSLWGILFDVLFPIPPVLVQNTPAKLPLLDRWASHSQGLQKSA